MHIFMLKHHVLCKEHEGAMAYILHLVHVVMHLLQHDVLASLFVHLCGDPAGGNDILAGVGRIQEK